MWRNDTKCRCMFMFPLKNLARKGLIHVLDDITGWILQVSHWHLQWWSWTLTLDLWEKSHSRWRRRIRTVSVSIATQIKSPGSCVPMGKNLKYWKTSNISRTLVGNKICWSLRCSWSIACWCCSNYIFILDLTPGISGLGKDNCKTRRETLKFLRDLCWRFYGRMYSPLWCWKWIILG